MILKKAIKKISWSYDPDTFIKKILRSYDQDYLYKPGKR